MRTIEEKTVRLVAIILYKQRNPGKRLTTSRINKVVRQYKKRMFTQRMIQLSEEIRNYIHRGRLFI